MHRIVLIMHQYFHYLNIDFSLRFLILYKEGDFWNMQFRRLLHLQVVNGFEN